MADETVPLASYGSIDAGDFEKRRNPAEILHRWSQLASSDGLKERLQQPKEIPF